MAMGDAIVRKRILQRFSLRGFLLASIILGSTVGWYSYRANRQRAIVEWVEGQGGMALYDFEYDPNSRFTPFMNPQASLPWPETFVNFLGVDYIATVVGISLYDGLENEVDLKLLAGLGQLKILEISVIDTKCDMSVISEFNKLTWLEITDCGVDDLSQIAGLTKLERLVLVSTQVSDLQPLLKLENLTTLAIEDAPVTDISPLAKLKSLRDLTLICEHIRDYEPLFELTNLKKLSVFQGADRLRIALPDCKVY